MVIIDTISIAERLRRAGMEQATANAVAKEVALNREEVATKGDLVAFEQYVDQRFGGMDRRFDGVERRFNFLQWLVVISVAAVGILLAALMIVLSL